MFRTLTQAGFAALAAQGGASEAALVGLAVIHALSAYLEVAGLYVIFLRAASLSQAGTDVAILGSAAALAFALGSATAGATAEALGYAFTFAAGATLCLAGGWHALSRIRGLGRITGDGEPAAGSDGRTSP